jgi:hypothetical protein
LVFFGKVQVNRWLSGNNLIMTLFSLSLLPLVIISETGIQFSDEIFYWCPMLFWIFMKLLQYIQANKIFSIRNEGYVYLILYLCALEILPVMLFLKGLFLIK